MPHRSQDKWLNAGFLPRKICPDPASEAMEARFNHGIALKNVHLRDSSDNLVFGKHLIDIFIEVFRSAVDDYVGVSRLLSVNAAIVSRHLPVSSSGFESQKS